MPPGLAGVHALARECTADMSMCVRGGTSEVHHSYRELATSYRERGMSTVKIHRSLTDLGMGQTRGEFQCVNNLSDTAAAEMLL